MKRSFGIIVSSLMVVGLLSGCTPKKMEANDVKDSFVNALVKNDEKEQKNLQISEKDINLFEKEFDTEKKKDIIGNFSGIGKISEKQQERALSVVKDGISKLDFKSKVISEDKKAKTVTVEYSFKGIDMYKYIEQWQKKLAPYQKKNPNIGLNKDKLVTKIIDFQEEVMKNPPLEKEDSKVQVTFKEKDGKWIPVDNKEVTKLLDTAYSY